MGRGLAAVMGNASEAVEPKETHLWAVEISILQLHKTAVSHERWHEVPATARSALTGAVWGSSCSSPSSTETCRGFFAR